MEYTNILLIVIVIMIIFYFINQTNNRNTCIIKKEQFYEEAEPTITYTGNHTNTTIGTKTVYYLLNDGILNITPSTSAPAIINVVLIGGGGSGGGGNPSVNASGGGGGGSINVIRLTIKKNTMYHVSIGLGGDPANNGDGVTGYPTILSNATDFYHAKGGHHGSQNIKGGHHGIYQNHITSTYGKTGAGGSSGKNGKEGYTIDIGGEKFVYCSGGNGGNTNNNPAPTGGGQGGTCGVIDCVAGEENTGSGGGGERGYCTGGTTPQSCNAGGGSGLVILYF